MRRAAMLPALTALALSAAPAAADDPLPEGRLSLILAGKSGTGRLANDIGLGYGFGFEAAYAPMGPTQTVGWGVAWSTVWSTFDGGARISGDLSMLEMDLGLRVRVALGARRRQVLWIGGGGMLLRTNDPIIPGDDRDHSGPFGAGGIEGRVRIPLIDWRVLLGVSARYGLIADGQGTFGVSLAVGNAF